VVRTVVANSSRNDNISEAQLELSITICLYNETTSYENSVKEECQCSMVSN